MSPAADALAGLDHLISSGTSDPLRTGIYGSSYGGALTTYVLTTVDRFRAGVSLDGAGLNNFDNAQLVASAPIYGEAYQTMRRLYGVNNPFDPLEQQSDFAESPLLHVSRIKTPLLLIAGKASLDSDVFPLYSALSRFDVPSPLLYYDMGHYPEFIDTQVDVALNLIDWMNYWICAIPIEDLGRAGNLLPKNRK